MNETFLQYVWANGLFRNINGFSTRGKSVRVLHVGQQNRDAGPDFSDAKIEIDGVLFVGTVEIHQKSSDWFRHGHDHDPAYKNVILSVVREADQVVVDCNGRVVETMVLDYVDVLWDEFVYMQHTQKELRCHRNLKRVDPFRMRMILSGYAVERLARKCESIKEMLLLSNYDWEGCFYRMLLRYWSGNVNREAFSQLALQLPYKIILRCGDALHRVEALIFGVSGLLENVQTVDAYVSSLRDEYAYQASKYQLTTMSSSVWKFMRIRPTAFPTVRIALLAALMFRFNTLFSRIMEAESIKEVKKLLDVETSSYWDTHYSFGVESAEQSKSIGDTLKSILLINAIVPFMFIYGKERKEEHYCEKAIRWLEELRGEKNRVTRLWEDCGFLCGTALDTQALLEIKYSLCDQHRCLDCKIGHEVFRSLQK